MFKKQEILVSCIQFMISIIKEVSILYFKISKCTYRILYYNEHAVKRLNQHFNILFIKYDCQAIKWVIREYDVHNENTMQIRLCSLDIKEWRNFLMRWTHLRLSYIHGLCFIAQWMQIKIAASPEPGHDRIP